MKAQAPCLTLRATTGGRPDKFSLNPTQPR